MGKAREGGTVMLPIELLQDIRLTSVHRHDTISGLIAKAWFTFKREQGKRILKPAEDSTRTSV
jgi:hypothetical protein